MHLKTILPTRQLGSGDTLSACASSQDGKAPESDSGSGRDDDARGDRRAPPQPPETGNDKPGDFKHPGVLVSGPQLEFIKSKVAAGAEPWTAAFNLAKASNLRWRPTRPSRATRSIAGSNSVPDEGCSDEVERRHRGLYQRASLGHQRRPGLCHKGPRYHECMVGGSASPHAQQCARPIRLDRLGVGARWRDHASRVHRAGLRQRPTASALMLKEAHLTNTLKGANEKFGSKQLVPTATGNW